MTSEMPESVERIWNEITEEQDDYHLKTTMANGTVVTEPMLDDCQWCQAGTCTQIALDAGDDGTVIIHGRAWLRSIFVLGQPSQEDGHED